MLEHSALGSTIKLPPEVLSEALRAIRGRGFEWRVFVEKMGSEAAFAAIVQNTANRILQGEIVDWSLLTVIKDCVFNGVPPIDMDIMLGLLRGASPDDFLTL